MTPAEIFDSLVPPPLVKDASSGTSESTQGVDSELVTPGDSGSDPARLSASASSGTVSERTTSAKAFFARTVDRHELEDRLDALTGAEQHELEIDGRAVGVGGHVVYAPGAGVDVDAQEDIPLPPELHRHDSAASADSAVSQASVQSTTSIKSTYSVESSPSIYSTQSAVVDTEGSPLMTSPSRNASIYSIPNSSIIISRGESNLSQNEGGVKVEERPPLMRSMSTVSVFGSDNSPVPSMNSHDMLSPAMNVNTPGIEQTLENITMLTSASAESQENHANDTIMNVRSDSERLNDTNKDEGATSVGPASFYDFDRRQEYDYVTSLHGPPLLMQLRNLTAQDALRLVFFAPWCVLMGATLLLAPTAAHVDAVAFRSGYFKQHVGLRRLQHHDETAGTFVLSYLAFLVLVCRLDAYVGITLVAGTVAQVCLEWSDFQVNEEYVVGEKGGDERQMLWMVLRDRLGGVTLAEMMYEKTKKGYTARVPRQGEVAKRDDELLKVLGQARTE